jgi:hypothetical protein
MLGGKWLPKNQQIANDQSVFNDALEASSIFTKRLLAKNWGLC